MNSFNPSGDQWNLETPSQFQFYQELVAIDEGNDHESDEDYEIGASQWPISKRKKRQREQRQKKKLLSSKKPITTPNAKKELSIIPEDTSTTPKSSSLPTTKKLVSLRYSTPVREQNVEQRNKSSSRTLPTPKTESRRVSSTTPGLKPTTYSHSARAFKKLTDFYPLVASSSTSSKEKKYSVKYESDNYEDALSEPFHETPNTPTKRSHNQILNLESTPSHDTFNQNDKNEANNKESLKTPEFLKNVTEIPDTIPEPTPLLPDEQETKKFLEELKPTTKESHLALFNLASKTKKRRLSNSLERKVPKSFTENSISNIDEVPESNPTSFTALELYPTYHIDTEVGSENEDELSDQLQQANPELSEVYDVNPSNPQTPSCSQSCSQSDTQDESVAASLDLGDLKDAFPHDENEESHLTIIYSSDEEDKTQFGATNKEEEEEEDVPFECGQRDPYYSCDEFGQNEEDAEPSTEPQSPVLTRPIRQGQPFSRAMSLFSNVSILEPPPPPISFPNPSSPSSPSSQASNDMKENNEEDYYWSSHNNHLSELDAFGQPIQPWRKNKLKSNLWMKSSITESINERIPNADSVPATQRSATQSLSAYNTDSMASLGAPRATVSIENRSDSNDDFIARSKDSGSSLKSLREPATQTLKKEFKKPLNKRNKPAKGFAMPSGNSHTEEDLLVSGSKSSDLLLDISQEASSTVSDGNTSKNSFNQESLASFSNKKSRKFNTSDSFDMDPINSLPTTVEKEVINNKKKNKTDLNSNCDGYDSSSSDSDTWNHRIMDLGPGVYVTKDFYIKRTADDVSKSKAPKVRRRKDQDNDDESSISHFEHENHRMMKSGLNIPGYDLDDKVAHTERKAKKNKNKEQISNQKERRRDEEKQLLANYNNNSDDDDDDYSEPQAPSFAQLQEPEIVMLKGDNHKSTEILSSPSSSIRKGTKRKSLKPHNLRTNSNAESNFDEDCKNNRRKRTVKFQSPAITELDNKHRNSYFKQTSSSQSSSSSPSSLSSRNVPSSQKSNSGLNDLMNRYIDLPLSSQPASLPSSSQSQTQSPKIQKRPSSSIQSKHDDSFYDNNQTNSNNNNNDYHDVNEQEEEDYLEMIRREQGPISIIQGDFRPSTSPSSRRRIGMGSGWYGGYRNNNDNEEEEDDDNDEITINNYKKKKEKNHTSLLASQNMSLSTQQAVPSTQDFLNELITKEHTLMESFPSPDDMNFPI